MVMDMAVLVGFLVMVLGPCMVAMGKSRDGRET